MSSNRRRTQISTQTPSETASTLLASYGRQIEVLRALGGHDATIAQIEALIIRIAGK